jgi:xanthine dehydrogenase molybdopterin-binding subunit B
MSMLRGLTALKALFGIRDVPHRLPLGTSMGPAPRMRWLVTPDGQTVVEVMARTRSEARAAAKRAMGISARLPISCRVQRLG